MSAAVTCAIPVFVPLVPAETTPCRFPSHDDRGHVLRASVTGAPTAAGSQSVRLP